MDIDDRNESVGKRIRDGEIEWIRYILVIGEKEVNSTMLNLRDRELGDVNQVSFENFIDGLKLEIGDKPFSKLNSAKHVSKRPQIMV